MNFYTYSPVFPIFHYFICAFSAKMATHSLVIDNAYFLCSKRNKGEHGGGGSQNYDGSTMMAHVWDIPLGQPGGILIFVILIVNGILTILSKCANMLILRYYLLKRMLIKKAKSQWPLNYFYVSQGNFMIFGLLKLLN